MHRCVVPLALRGVAEGGGSSSRRAIVSATATHLSWKGPDNSAAGAAAAAANDATTSTKKDGSPSATSSSTTTATTATATATHKLSSDKNAASNLGNTASSTSAFLDHLPKRLAYLTFVQGRKFIAPAIALPTTLAMCTSYIDFGASLALMCIAQRILTRSLGSASFAAAKAAAAPTIAKYDDLISKLVPAGGETARAAALKELRAALPLAGQVAVVTGATGPIGGMAANELRALGAHVYISHRAQSSTDRQVLVFHPNSQQPKDGEKAPEQLHHPLTSIPLDLADRNSVRSFVQILNDLVTKRAEKEGSSSSGGAATPAVDILVHAASTSQYVFGLTKAHKTDPHIEVNFTGPLLMTESLLPLLRSSQLSGLPNGGAGATTITNTVGGRIVYVGCTSHSLIGRKYTGKEVAEGYAKEDSWIMKKYRADPDDDTSYIGNVMDATSKLGSIYHTQSLHERRLSGINLKDRASKLHPYSACCAILPSLDLPKYCEPYKGNLVKSDGDQRQDPHSFTASWLGQIQNAILPFRTKPEAAVENVLECCLSPTLVSGGMYVEGKELSGRDDNVNFIQRALSGALSLKAKDLKEQKLMVGYGAELTRHYAVRLAPSSSSTTTGGKH